MLIVVMMVFIDRNVTSADWKGRISLPKAPGMDNYDGCSYLVTPTVFRGAPCIDALVTGGKNIDTFLGNVRAHDSRIPHRIYDELMGDWFGDPHHEWVDTNTFGMIPAIVDNKIYLGSLIHYLLGEGRGRMLIKGTGSGYRLMELDVGIRISEQSREAAQSRRHELVLV